MLNLDIHHNGKTLSLELPVPTEVLAAELRVLGIGKTLNHIQQSEFTLQPLNQLGEHFMKLVQPDDTLQAIALYSREFDVLAGESWQALADLVMTDRFRDLNHMGDYLRYGPAALDYFIRVNLDDQQIDLPASAHELQIAGITQPNEISLRNLDLMPLNEQGKQLLIELSIYENLATANLACAMLTVPGITASMREVAESARRLLPEQPTQTMNFYCPLKVRMEDDDGMYLEEADPTLLIYHEDRISEALQNEFREGENMADYLHDEKLKQKVTSAKWDIAKIGGVVYGKISCELRAPLTAVEQANLADWITGQNSDGLGEGFEQRPVDTDDGELYVSLWHSGPGYYLLPEEEFRARVLEQELDTQGFGGMEGMS